MRRGTIGIISLLLGATCWVVGLHVGPGPTPIAAGVWYLVIVATAGFVVALVEGELSWTALAGLYVGQLVVFGLQTLLNLAELASEPLRWQPFFILSVMLAAALGGIVGAILSESWRGGHSSRER